MCHCALQRAVPLSSPRMSPSPVPVCLPIETFARVSSPCVWVQFFCASLVGPSLSLCLSLFLSPSATSQLLPETELSGDQRTRRIEEVQVQHSYDMFRRGHHDRAMDRFFELKQDPLKVIGLFAGMLPRCFANKFKYPVEIPELGECACVVCGVRPLSV